MNFAVDDTIAAVASPPGGAIRGVIRVSGPDTVSCLRQCFRAAASRTLDDVRVPTRIFGHLHIPPPIGALPCHVYLWPTCRSYTRQPSAELHTIGSPPLLDAALDASVSMRCAAGSTGRIHPAGIPGRPAGSHPGRSCAGCDRCRELARTADGAHAIGRWIEQSIAPSAQLRCSTCSRTSKRDWISWTRISSSSRPRRSTPT